MRLFSLLALVVSFVLVTNAGCTSRRRTHTERTATQQILMTDALDRSLHQLQWPSLQGRSVLVRAFCVATPLDREYLRGAAEAYLAAQGARVVYEPEDAEFVLTVLASAIGTDHTEKLLGTPEIESVIVTVPEIAFYKSDTQQGFAKVSYVLQDTKNGTFVYRSGPAQATTYVRTRRILFFGRYTTDTTRYDVE